MHAIFLTLLSTASAAELAPAHVIGNSVDFEHDGQVIVPPAFGQALANDLTPSNWILPEVQLVSWGVLVSDGHAVDGVVWAEIDDGGQSPFLVLVMDRTLDEGAVPIGPGSLLAEMAPTTSGLPNHTWSPELLDLALSEFQGFPNGPIDAEEEASVAYSTSSVIVILTGCPGHGRSEGAVPGPQNPMDDLPEDPGDGEATEEEAECPTDDELGESESE